MKLPLYQLILEKLLEIGEGVIDSFFPAKYPEARIWRSLLGVDSSYVFSKNSFSSILSKMKKDGFVERKHNKRNAIWSITSKGKKYLQRRSSEDIQPKSDGITRIVIFDIPEKQREKRRWLRRNLIEFYYTQLQKSVWIGDVPLPEKFFQDADILSLRDHLHVFTVHQKGTVDKIKNSF